MVDDEDRTENRLDFPVGVELQPQLEGRNRLTTAFRFFLALPHIILVGGPIAVYATFGWQSEHWDVQFSAGGLLAIVVCVTAFLSWVAILITGRHPQTLWDFAAFYMRWRVRAVSYLMLLRDEYPPFGDGEYPADLRISRPVEPRDRLTVLVRFFLVLPHAFVLWLLGAAWALSTAIAWILILITGRYPATMYGFAIGVLAWSTRVEAYVLLLRDEYPPFTLRA
jgi:hypothetical protein